ncbi:hypothetical protein Tco_0875507 [Tanacetum coccineum]|uniref:Uncharacterized protein n=1 Tax=Tanacetum coccineum TaxID=301880 RepID=A0ABQ5BSI2_9ASTR
MLKFNAPIKIKLERDSDGKVHAKKIDDVPCSVEKGNVNVVKVANHKVINAAKDKIVQFIKKKVPKKINAKVTIKRSAKAVEVSPDKVVDAAKKKGAAITQLNSQELQLKSLKMIIKRLKEETREKTMYTKPFSIAEKKILEYIWSYDSPEGDIIFTGKGLEIECIWFFSLYPEIQLSSNIIDLWSTILNDEEKYRGKQLVTRNIYCSTGMLDLNCDAVLVNSHEDLNNKGKRLEVFIEEKDKEDKADEDVPDIKKGRSTSTSISIESIADHIGAKKKIFGKKTDVEPHPISIDEYNDSESDSEYTRIIKKTKKKNRKMIVIEIYSESDEESSPVEKKEKIKMVLTEKYLKKKCKLVVEDSKITKKDLRKKGKMVVPIDEDEEL